MAEIRIGDRVYYVSGKHGQSESNPLNGTKYECEGTVVDNVQSYGLTLRVNWDNGESNIYGIKDLVVIGKPNPADPNEAFQRKKCRSGYGGDLYYDGKKVFKF